MTSKVAAYLTFHIDRSSKSQKEIAQEAGFERPNFISMLKQGVAKVPVERIPALAKALDVDTGEFFRLVVGEYMPELLKLIDEVYDLHKNETEILKRVRLISGGRSVKLSKRTEPLLDEFVKESMR